MKLKKVIRRWRKSLGLFGPPRGHYTRGRGLESFQRRFPEHSVEAWIESRLAAGTTGEPVRVLELGCGEGRVLLELKKRFPSIEVHGLNREPWPAMRGPKSVEKQALRRGILDRAAIAEFGLPEVHFHDASDLQFEDDTFDLILSQVAIPHMDRKDRVLTESWRVLKRGGLALLDMDTREPDPPDLLETEMPRFLVYDGDQRVSRDTWLEGLRSRGVEITVRETESERNPGKVRVGFAFIKSFDEPLDLRLEFDAVSSFRLSPLRRATNGDPRRSPYWGFRCVYQLSGASSP